MEGDDFMDKSLSQGRFIISAGKSSNLEGGDVISRSLSPGRFVTPLPSRKHEFGYSPGRKYEFVRWRCHGQATAPMTFLSPPGESRTLEGGDVMGMSLRKGDLDISPEYEARIWKVAMS